MQRREFGVQIFVLFLLITVMAACTPPNSARGVVDRFIEARYILIDHNQMQALCTGLALDKIHEEIKLTEGQAIDQSTRKPVVHYTLQKTRSEGDKMTFLLRRASMYPRVGPSRSFG